MTLTTLRLSKNGQTVALREQGSGPPVVLLHGVGMQSAAWGPQIEVLATTHRVLAVDLPGHGGSDPLPVGSELPDYVAWLNEVVRTLELKTINLAGHSMGALIAAGFATQHPERTLRVALLNGVFRRSDGARQAVRARAADIRNGVVDIDTPLSRWFSSDPEEDLARNHVAQWLRDVDSTAYATAYTAFANGDAIYADMMSQIRCPFLALTGDGDPNSTPEMSKTMATTVQHGTAITIRGHRHMVNLTAPDLVNTHLQDWLKHPIQQKELQ